MLTCLLLVAPGCAAGRSSPDLGTAAQRGSTGGEETTATAEPEEGPGRLTARPRKDVAGDARTGTFELDVGDGRPPLLFVPESYDPRKPAPFALTLHGANAGAPNGMKRLLPYAEEHGLILGTTDPILPIGSTSRRYVPQLRRAGYDVTYTEFEGGHRTPQNVATEAVEWFLDERTR